MKNILAWQHPCGGFRVSNSRNISFNDTHFGLAIFNFFTLNRVFSLKCNLSFALQFYDLVFSYNFVFNCALMFETC